MKSFLKIWSFSSKVIKRILLRQAQLGKIVLTPLPPPQKKNSGGYYVIFGQNFFLVVENRVLGRKKIYFKINFFSSQNPIFHDQKKKNFPRKLHNIPNFLTYLWGGGGQKNFPQSRKKFTVKFDLRYWPEYKVMLKKLL